MKTLEISPGNWQVLEAMGKQFVATKAYEGHPYFGVSRYVDVAGDEDYPRKEADLNLISAAPEMYEVLDALSSTTALAGLPKLQEAMNVALNKARGVK